MHEPTFQEACFGGLKFCCCLQEEYNLQALLPYGYIEGHLERLSHEEFEMFMRGDLEELFLRGGALEQGENAVNGANVDPGWTEVRRRQVGDRSSLWRMWLQGLKSTDPRVKALLQPYEFNAQEYHPEEIPIDPWTLSTAERKSLSERCTSSLYLS
jgi:hypothetical protein